MSNSRGSFWRKADFHIHTPLSYLNNEFGQDFDTYVQTMLRKAIETKVNIIGITDYFSIDGYKKLKTEYLEKPEKLKTLFIDEEIRKINSMLILPNIEFRINKIIQINKYKDGEKIGTESGRVNFHIIFSNEVSIKTIEENFLHDIHFIYEADPTEPDKMQRLKIDNLIKLGQRLKNEQPDLKGTDVVVGMNNAVVDDQQVCKLLSENKDFKDKYLIVVPVDEDLSEISWKSQEHLTRKVILQRAQAFFSSNRNTVEFGLGQKHPSLDSFEREFKTLKPCIWGSDAHSFGGLFEPKNKNYCWIKSELTFNGVRQILFEPEDRVYIGEQPALFTKIYAARGNYIDSIEINQIENYSEGKGVWFKNFDLQIGLELTAIIGNKGKGKSAIADIIALLGNAHVPAKDFSFLNASKFCQKGFAENFIGRLKWFDKNENTKLLNEGVDFTDVSRVKYIPQTYLEKLCNDENSGFKDEINKVVFSRLEESDKLGKQSFEELEEYLTNLVNQEIAIILTKIDSINKSILQLNNRQKKEYVLSIENNKKLKEQEMDIHEQEKEKIIVVQNPENDPNISKEQKELFNSATKLEEDIRIIENQILAEHNKLRLLKIELSEHKNFLSSIENLENSLNEWLSGHDDYFQKYKLVATTIFSYKSDKATINRLIRETEQKIAASENTLSAKTISTETGVELGLTSKLTHLTNMKLKIEYDLNKPLKEYQDYLLKEREWNTRAKEIIGDELTENTLKYYEAELTYVKNQLPIDINEKLDQRKKLIQEVYNRKKHIQGIYDKMKQAISNILMEFAIEQNISIETSFKIDRLFFSKFFDFVNRYGDFYQNGDDYLSNLVNNQDFNSEEDVQRFLKSLEDSNIRFKEGRELDFHNYIYSLGYLNPEYELRLNGKSLNQLSPGEKGGLLLVFYLVLDKDDKPLIIDQPEDNLDNQSVAEILVPYIKKAKKRRQIIMVTHNPNLAIVADAEQVIYMNIDKEDNYAVSFDSGGIENAVMNKHIVNILEGRMKAFENRRVKYTKM
ncbi:hypothetical protein QT327_06985 [Olivibacter sp. 47]|uniref:TrlF family AAA-like ATPase n=1 Tax=Olivibacter sp. 47 TaxID=3056486 RepID=UPI0025A3759F|nr:hypothetical protein [Olivibacter sp. 47]MDM8174100.1 hypothetical protein [Olivibacter sp. 47]